MNLTKNRYSPGQYFDFFSRVTKSNVIPYLFPAII